MYRAQSCVVEDDTDYLQTLNAKLFDMPFDPESRDRKLVMEEHDLVKVTITTPQKTIERYASQLIRMRIKEVRRIVPEPEGLAAYLQNLQDAGHYIKSPYNDVEEALQTSNDILPRRLLLEFDPGKEAILWHGTSENASNALVASCPRQNKGAYGKGFYLTPHLGKADQYARADGLEGRLCLIAFRVIMQGVQYNPHLDARSRADLPISPISYVTMNFKGIPVRYHEVVTRCDEGFMIPVAVLIYERYENEIIEANAESPADGGETGVRRRKAEGTSRS